VAIIGLFLVPNLAASLLQALESGIFGQVVLLLSPADVLDGVNAFLFRTVPDNPAVWRSDIDGWVFLVVAGCWVVGSLAVLAWRYRTIEA
jgi:hypothetical protein